MFTAHPWLRDEKHDVPLDILIYKLVKSYVRATPFKHAALKVTYIYKIRAFPILANVKRKKKRQKKKTLKTKIKMWAKQGVW